MLNYLTTGQPAPTDWLAGENTELARLSRPARGGRGGGQAPAADVLLAAFRPVKVLADALAK